MTTRRDRDSGDFWRARRQRSADTLLPDDPAEAVEVPLLPAVARGEPAAVQGCIARYGSMIWSVARRRSPTVADAEDATQEIFLDLWRSAARFDGARMSEGLFVMMIARRRLIDRHRSSRSRIRHEVSAENLPEPIDAAPLADVATEGLLALEALERLPPEQRHLIHLSVSLGLSHAQIAQQEHLPLGTVKTVIRRGLIRIRQALGVPSANQGSEP